MGINKKFNVLVLKLKYENRSMRYFLEKKVVLL